VDFKELERMKVDQLREEASKLEGVEGVSGMKKQELIDLLSEKLGIERPKAEAEETAAKDAEPEKKADAKAEAGDEAEAKPEATPPSMKASKTIEAKAAKETKPEPKVAEKKPSPFKSRLKALQAKRRQALADRDHETLADVRMRIKKYKRKMKRESGAAASSS
jgi:Rho termination factor, N-terminal domain